jgi:hypothetical protein
MRSRIATLLTVAMLALGVGGTFAVAGGGGGGDNSAATSQYHGGKKQTKHKKKSKKKKHRRASGNVKSNRTSGNGRRGSGNKPAFAGRNNARFAG